MIALVSNFALTQEIETPTKMASKRDKLEAEKAKNQAEISSIEEKVKDLDLSIKSQDLEIELANNEKVTLEGKRERQFDFA